MKTLEGVRIDAVAVTELRSVPSDEREPLTVTAALYDMKGNQTIGISQHTSIWSKATYDALAKLYECVEGDIATHISGEGGDEQKPIDATGTQGGLFPDQK
jgi:hypothetical protein